MAVDVAAGQGYADHPVIVMEVIWGRCPPTSATPSFPIHAAKLMLL